MRHPLSFLSLKGSLTRTRGIRTEQHWPPLSPFPFSRPGAGRSVGGQAPSSGHSPHFRSPSGAAICPGSVCWHRARNGRELGRGSHYPEHSSQVLRF